MGILLLPVGLIAGYFFLKYYKGIEHKLFNSIDGYQPVDIKIVYLSAIVGAIFGCIGFFQMGGLGDKYAHEQTHFAFITVFAILTSMGVFHTFLELKSIKAVVLRSIFTVISCVLATYIGLLASVILLCLLLFMLGASFIGKVSMDTLMGNIEGKGKTTLRTNANGKQIRVKDLGNGDFIGDDNRLYRDKGDNQVESYQ